MRKLAIASLLVAAVAFSGSVLATQSTAAQPGSGKSASGQMLAKKKAASKPAHGHKHKAAKTAKSA
ncbi:hypothetical protein [Dyella silvatica]|uniref:hypothetical protein n=1 Tax=Dyella silvatica TaxID=2992128 RepID=UPI0022502ABA|nr:hypothetical protein [Dyella silvatica]